MKKILMITNHSYMFWQFRRELALELQKKFEVVLCMPFVGHEDDFQELGFRCIETKIDRRGVNPVTDAKLIRTYREILKSERPDLVITYSIKPNIYAGTLCGEMGIPYFANVQGLGTAFQKKGLAQFVTVLYRNAFRHVRKVFFENEKNAEEFRSRHIIDAEKQVILKGAGVNLDYYALQPYPEHKQVHFLYLGRIMREKGMDELFAAAKRLKEDGESFVIDFCGFFEDEYKTQVEELEKQGICRFHGFQEDPRPFYRDADCVVLPSCHEGMSNVLLEAAATGRPLITSDIPGCREAVDRDRSGFLVPVKDSDSLYAAMKKMLHLSAEERAEMGANGRQKMEREFDKKDVVDATIRALGSRSSKTPEKQEVFSKFGIGNRGRRLAVGSERTGNKQTFQTEKRRYRKLSRSERYQNGLKRGIDIVLSAMGLLVLGIPMLIVAIVIMVEDPGPAIFTQKRVGKGKTYFNLYKFRSMKTNTPDIPTHLLENPEQYITKTGAFIRKTSIDELPQLINILRGDMSIVGPRPALWNQDDLIAERDKYGANDVRPGLTGWAQINGRDELEIPVKAKLDGEYVRRMGLLMDLRCFFGTITKVLSEDGVVEGGTGSGKKK